MIRKDTSKNGFTLLEVMMATVIIGILAVCGAAYFGHAARFRMMARAQQAATIEANSLMEWAYQAAHRDHYNAAPGYYNPANNMSFGNDPSATWTFDGVDYPVSVYLDADADDVALITVTVDYFGSRDVILTAYRYCEDD